METNGYVFQSDLFTVSTVASVDFTEPYTFPWAVDDAEWELDYNFEWPYDLLVDGCQQDGTEAPNCTRVCTNTSWLLTSQYAINSCAVASRIASNLTHSDTATIEGAHMLGIQDGSPTISQIVSELGICLSSYCDSSINACASRGSKCASLVDPPSDPYAALAALSNCTSLDLCPNTALTVNGDLGGIGVGTVQF